MQKHKKWLVITIWVSTIAFIAAGMVGWGSLDFSFDRGVVAKVGDVKITQSQLESRFRQIFDQYNAEGGLDLDKARELGLERLALNGLIQRALLQNFANEIGIYVSQKEVQEEIAKQKFFQETDMLGQSKFSPKLYEDLLKQNNILPSVYEESIKEDLFIKKAMALLPDVQVTKLEKETFLFPFQIQDSLNFEVLFQSQIHPKPKTEEIKEFWKQNQTQFMYPAEYKIEYIMVSDADQKPTQEDLKKLYEETKSQFLDESGNFQPFESVKEQLISQKKSEMAEEKALLEYVKLKEAQAVYGAEERLIEGEKKMGLEVQEAIEGAGVGETISPIRTAEGYVVVKVVEKKPQNPKSYEDAKEEAKELLVQKLRAEQLVALAKEKVAKGFKGSSGGYVDLISLKTLKGLDPQESMRVISEVLKSRTPKGYVLLGEKAVVFEIKDQKILQNLPEQVSEKGAEELRLFKEELVRKEFFKYLENKYKITQLKTL